MEKPECAALAEKANDILGFDLAGLMKNGPEDKLKQTEFTQPALFLAGQMAVRLLPEDAAYHYVAGHSLGEYSALCAAGALRFEDGLKLVRLRGQLMAEAGEKQSGAMSAVLGLEADALDKVLEEAQFQGVVVVANYNSPAQIVISGEEKAIAEAEKLCKEYGAKRVVRLPVSGAFHSPLMAGAAHGLKEALASITFLKPEVPVITNVEAEPCDDPDTLRNLLVEQLTASVRWVEIIEKCVSLGCDRAWELGAGKVLMGLCRAIDRSLSVTVLEST